MGVGAKKGGIFWICETPQNEDLNQTQFESLTWVQVDCVVTEPDMGAEENIITQYYVDKDVSKQKGNVTPSDSELVVGYDPDSTGQDVIDVASQTNFEYAIAVEYKNPDAGYTNAITYSRALIGLANRTGGGPEDWNNLTYPIALVQRPITVKPVVSP